MQAGAGEAGFRRFQDRAEAGTLLGESLRDRVGGNAVVFGVARGGVVTASAVAGVLGVPFDVLVARKLAVPWNPEAGFGAVAEDRVALYDSSVAELTGVSDAHLQELIDGLSHEVSERVTRFRGTRERLGAAGRVAIVVDDGIASGYTLATACDVVRAGSPSRLLAGAPAGSAAGVRLVGEHADAVETLIETPPAEPFAVGFFYRDFHQVSDDDVAQLLDESREAGS